MASPQNRASRSTSWDRTSTSKGAQLRLIAGHDDLLQALFNRASIGITVMDLSGQFVQANPAFLHMLQYDIQELQQLTVEGLTHPDDWPACMSHLGELIAGNHESFQIEKRLRRRDKEYITVRVTVSLTSSDPSETRFLIGVAEDVTERAAAEARMEHLLSLLTATLESSADGVLVLDRDLKVEAYNERYAEMWRVPVELLVLRDDRVTMNYARDHLKHPDLLGEAVQRLQANPSAEWVNIYEFKDGQVLESHVRPRVVEGAVRGWVATYRDITERLGKDQARRNVMQQIMTAQEDERRRLARELHDETGQALTALKVNLKLALDAPEGEGRAHLERAREISSRVLGDLRQLARGLRPAVLDDLGLLPALQGIARDFAQADHTSIDVSASGLGADRLAPEIEITVYRIVQESLTNAIKHAGARRVRIHLHCRGETLSVLVHDDGKGFLMGEKGSNPFASGLDGIAERAALVEGRVRISSRPGGGTSVYVRIPVSQTKAEAT